MEEAFARFTCPECDHEWERQGTLPDPNDELTCGECGEVRRASEFTRAKGDLETLKTFA